MSGVFELRCTRRGGGNFFTGTVSVYTGSRKEMRANISCALLLGPNGTHDIPPVRASFAVMDHVARLAAGRSFVEIGSRHGDLIDCVSHVTSSAVTIERDHSYCPTLAQRATASQGRFRSICAAFSSTLDPMPAADLYFTWIQHYLNVWFLAWLRMQQLRGAVPRGAKLAMGFSDEGYMAEHLCWLSLKRFADSWQNIYYDERKPFETGTSPCNNHCRRRRGYTTVALFAPATLNISAVHLASRRACQTKGDTRSLAQ